MMMPVLLDAAVRSLLFGLLVWATLKLVRLRDTGGETFIWTAVLVVALSMPLLNHYLPHVVVAVPYLSSAPPHPLAARPWAGRFGVSLTRLWLARYGQTCLVGTYILGLVVCLTRLALGLLLSLRVYLRADPIDADWARGRHVRVNATLKSPASLARMILLPADYCGWSAAKREAVLAHEEAHIARGDFLVQLAASVHCALFWFSPFPWWLRSKLVEIAEIASDEAAIRRLNDRVTYAEILLEVACGAKPASSIVAMARGPFIQRRVERILSEARSQRLSAPLLVLVIGCLALAAAALASAKAVIDPIPSIARSEKVSPLNSHGETRSLLQASPAAFGTRRMRARVSHRANDAESRRIAPSRDDEVSYNPRAPLDPVYTPAGQYVPASTIVHAGKTFYIRSTEKPVAEVSAADGIYREAN